MTNFSTIIQEHSTLHTSVRSTALSFQHSRPPSNSSFLTPSNPTQKYTVVRSPTCNPIDLFTRWFLYHSFHFLVHDVFACTVQEKFEAAPTHVFTMPRTLRLKRLHVLARQFKKPGAIRKVATPKIMASMMLMNAG